MILHVLGSMTAGGNERLCLELIRRAPPATAAALLTIDPVPTGVLTSLFTSVRGLQLFHEPYSPEARLGFLARLAWRLRTLKPSGMIIYPFGLHVLVAAAAKAAPRCPLIVHVGNPPPPQGPRRELFRRIVLASRVLDTPLWCCSETVYAQFLQMGAPMPRGSRPLPNGVNVEALRRAAARGKVQRGDRGPIIGMVARLDEIKDHDTLLAAFGRVRQTFPTALLWLVGIGNRKEELQQRAQALGVEASVSFLGARQDIGELLGQLDLFAFSTTEAEGFGIALAEAMAVGLPIVASNVAACREVLNNGSCGRLVPPRDPEQLADTILAILRDTPERRRELTAAAEERARDVYDIGVCAQKYYNYLLGDPASAS